MSGIAIN